MEEERFGSAPIKYFGDLIYVSPEWEKNYNKLDARQKQVVNEYLEESLAKVIKEIDDDLIGKIKGGNIPPTS